MVTLTMNIISHKALKEEVSNIPSDSLIRLIYISDMNTTGDSVFKHIQHHSEFFNKSNGITGFLCNNQAHFFQCLEGTKDAVLFLMRRIFKDANHKDVDVIFTKQISDYSFSDWRMHSLNLDNNNWKKLSEHTKLSDISLFKPETWPHWFVEHFIDHIKTFDYSRLDNLQDYVTFDTLGYSELEKKLVTNGILLSIFFALLLCSTAVVMVFRYDIIL